MLAFLVDNDLLVLGTKQFGTAGSPGESSLGDPQNIPNGLNAVLVHLSRMSKEDQQGGRTGEIHNKTHPKRFLDFWERRAQLFDPQNGFVHPKTGSLASRQFLPG